MKLDLHRIQQLDGNGNKKEGALKTVEEGARPRKSSKLNFTNYSISREN